MSNSDLLAELRAWRDEFARSHGYDLRAMAAALRERDAAAGARVVRGEPRPPRAVLPRPSSSPQAPATVSSVPLSERDETAVLAAAEQPPAPNEAALQAARRYSQRHG